MNWKNNVNYKNTIPDSNLGGEEYQFNMYYTKWCSYSQKAKPGFKNLQTQIANINKNTTTHINVNLIDVEDANNDDQTKEDLKHLKIMCFTLSHFSL